MREMKIAGGRATPLWLAVLGACALWLVLQNTLLAAVVMWSEPEAALALARVLVRAGALVIAEFWGSAAGALTVGALLGVALGSRVLAPARKEARHG